MQTMSLCPGGLELAFGSKHREVNVAQIVGLAASEGAEQHDSEVGRRARGLRQQQYVRPLAEALRRGSSWPVGDSGHSAIFSHGGWRVGQWRPPAIVAVAAGVRAAPGEVGRA